MENIKDLIKEYCEEYCDSNDSAYEYIDNYSGRGFHGKSCVAVVCNNPLKTLCSLFSFIVDSDYEISGYDVEFALGEPEQDSMGKRSILYFPSLKTE